MTGVNRTYQTIIAKTHLHLCNINISHIFFCFRDLLTIYAYLRLDDGVLGIADQFSRSPAEPRKRFSFSLDADASCVETAQSFI